MTFDDFSIDSTKRFHNDSSGIDAAEAELGIRFPDGYREFMTRFGEGALADYVRVYPPHQLLAGDNCVVEWRKRIEEYWFWDDGIDVLTKEKALESCIIADTLDGDELITHPSDPDRLYVLPRHEEMIYVAGDGLLAAIEWLLTSGTLTDPIEERNFDPFDSQQS